MNSSYTSMLDKAIGQIKSASRIAIAAHINPDGDTIGSMLALYLALSACGKEVVPLSYDGVPEQYKHLPGAGAVRRTLGQETDLVITVDCNSAQMLGGLFEDLEKAPRIIEIDHHSSREPFGGLELIDTEAASVGEQIWQLLKRMEIEITTPIAENILTSIVVETGSFRLPNVRPLTFEICRQALEMGVDYYRLVDNIYWSYAPQTVILTGLCLSRAHFEADGRLVWSIIYKDDFREMKGLPENVDAVADELRAIKGVELVVFFREERPGSLRVSLRSKNNLDVSRLARRFGGGGHFDVAGCAIEHTREGRRELLEAAENLLSEWKKQK